MCTVTWARTGEGYVVFFNRDEQRTRPPAEPPRRWERNGVAYLAPRDPQGGGTWLAVNEHGLTVGLLNYYAAGNTARAVQSRSRGQLVAELVALATPEAVWAQVGKMDLTIYPPFILLTLAPDGSASSGRWDGERWERNRLSESDRFITTSSFRSSEVVARRRALFQSLGGGLSSLRAFHTSRDPEDDAFSVWMARPDAHTVSLSQITVESSQIQFSYASRDDDHRPGPESVLNLPRR